MPSSVPVIDLTPWFGPHESGGDEAAARAAVAAEVDAALQSVGFFLIKIGRASCRERVCLAV